MTEITSNIAQFRSLTPQPEKTNASVAAKNKDEGGGGPQGLQAVVADIQAQRLELLLSVTTESKTTFSFQQGFLDRAAAGGVDLSQLQYHGKPFTEITPEEAAGLVAEDGEFGVAKTSQRLADFVITGGGDDLKKLQAGREGIIKGFKEAEAIWGGALPEISHQTLDKALALIDSRIRELGGSAGDAGGALVNVQA